MAAARPSAPPIYVLNGYVDLEPPLTGEPGQGWTRIECASKKAYGCVKSIEEAVQGLTLYVHLGDGPLVTSSLAIRMSDEAFRRFYSELDEPGARRKELPKMDAVGSILKTEQDLIVMALRFRSKCSDDSECLFYFLLYDSIDASLSVINYLPDLYQATGALQTVPNRTVGGACELLLTAREMTSGLPHVLCVFSPATSANSACPWQIKGASFPRGEIREPFMATTAFSFQGKGFWADLTQGLVYCDLHTTSDCNSAVDFGFIELPGGCKLDVAETLRWRDEPRNITRTVGCSGDYIWFICIDRATEYEDDSVTMWTLQSPHGRWKVEWKFSTRELWGFDSFKEAGLPEAPPEFPFLTADGDLCFVLTDQRRPFEDDVLVGHIYSIDVPNKRVLWHGKVHNYPFTEPVALPSSFFQGSMVHTWKFGDNRPAAGLASLAETDQLRSQGA